METKVNLSSFIDDAKLCLKEIKSMHDQSLFGLNLKVEFGDISKLTLLNVFNQRTPEPNHCYIFWAPERFSSYSGSIDQRTDIYCLGILFYIFITGNLPFVVQHDCHWPEAHRLWSPIPPIRLNKSMPQVLSDIILKCLAKEPDDRYQSVESLLFDINTLQTHWPKPEELEKFEIGSYDRQWGLKSPNYLNGFHSEKRQLRELVAKHIKHTGLDFILIRGAVGCGKRYLLDYVGNLTKDYLDSIHILVEIEENKNFTPLQGLKQIIQTISENLVARSPETINKLKNEIERRLGNSVYLLKSLSPELGFISSERPAPKSSGNYEDRILAEIILELLLKFLIHTDTHITLSLANLHWLDKDSLKIIQKFIRTNQVLKILVVGSMQDVDPLKSKPIDKLVTLQLLNWASTLNSYTLIDVTGLSRRELSEFVAEALRCKEIEVRDLANVLYDKLGGNPLITLHSLGGLLKADILYYDPKDTHFKWNEQKLSQFFGQNDKDELLNYKLSSLSKKNVELLQFISIYGQKIEISLLTTLLSMEQKETVDFLTKAMNENIISIYDGKIQFSHYYYRNVIYNTTLPSQRDIYHLMIAKHFEQLYLREDRSPDLYTSVEHYHLAAAAMSESELKRFIRYAYTCGIWSMDIHSYAAAVFFLEQSIAAIQQLGHSIHEKQEFNILFSLAQSYYRLGREEKVSSILNTLSQKNLSPKHQLSLICFQIEVLVSSLKLTEALELGEKFLGRIRRSSHVADIQGYRKNIAFIQKSFSQWSGDFWNQPLFGKNQIHDAMLRLFNSLMYPAFLLQHPILKYLSAEGVVFSIRRGLYPSSLTSFLWLSLCLSESTNAHDELSRDLGQFALKISDKFLFEQYQIQSRVLYCNMSQLRQRPIFQSRVALTEAISSGKRIGHPTFSYLACYQLISLRLFSGDPLDDVYLQALELKRLAQTGQETLTDLTLAGQLDFISHLSKDNGPPPYQRNEMGQLAPGGNTKYSTPTPALARLWTLGYRLQAEYIFGNLHTCREIFQEALPLHSDNMNLESILFIFFGCLTLIRSAAETDTVLSASDTQWLKSRRQHLRKLASRCPENFLVLSYILKAEYATLKGDSFLAIKLFPKALQIAKKQQQIPMAAIICESMHRLFFKLKLPEVAKVYLSESIETYRRWGALKKVHQLLNRSLPVSRGLFSSPPCHNEYASYSMELEEVIKSVWDIDENKQMNFLMNRLVSVTQCEATFVASYNLQGTLQMFQFLRGDLISSKYLFPPDEKHDSKDYPGMIMNYVTNTGLVLWGEMEILPTHLRQSNYLKIRHPRNIICVPLTFNNEILGSIFLESASHNNLRDQHLKGFVEGVAKILATLIRNSHLKKRMQEEQAKVRRIKNDYFLSEQVFENSRDSIFVLDAEYRIISINRAFSQMTGFKKNEIKGQKIAKLYLGINSKETILSLQADLNQKGYWQGDLQSRRKDGDVFTEWLSLVAVRLTEKHPPKYIGIFFDLTDRKKMEQALKDAKDVAERAVKVRSQFLANISHEIRTPMNAILGFSELGIDIQDCDVAKNYFTKINSSASILLNLINDVLDFSKIEAGKLQLSHTSFNCREVLKEIVALMDVKAREKNLQINLIYPQELSTFFYSDPLRLQQILMNLISNAIKFTPKGYIDISVQRTPDHLIRFLVEDTGIGIAEADQKKLFQPFSQVDGSSTRKFGGTGLGLAICHELTTLLGGKIFVESLVGQGSKFWIDLPLKEAPSKESQLQPLNQEQTPLEPLGEQSIHCLLVEDNPINQLVAKEMLRSCHIGVTVAGNGQEAVDELKRNPYRYQLVFMDVQMPQLDGYAATEIIRKTLGLQDLPIIGLTAHAFKDEQQQCYQVGMTEVLAKPVRKSDLLKVIGLLAPKEH